MARHRLVLFILGGTLAAVALGANPPADPLEQLNNRKPQPLSPSTRPREPKLEKAIERGFRFLDKWQEPDGSWNRIGEVDEALEGDADLEWRIYDHREYRDFIVKDLAEGKTGKEVTANVADTALAGRAMLMAVTSGQHPEYVPKIKKAIEFLCTQVDTWNGGDKLKTVYIQDRVFDTLHDQTPALGEVRFYDATVDTFFTLAFLAQAKSAVEDPQLARRIDRALKILQFKIESTQDLNGTWIDDTDPLAKMNDKLGTPPILGQVMPPDKARVTPENPRLPRDDIAKAELYDPDHKNLLVHCQQLRDISFAIRHGVDFKMATRFKAENYLLKHFNEKRWQQTDDGPYARDVSPRAILLTSVVAAWYQVHLTAEFLAAEAQKASDAGEKVDANMLGTLKQHVQETRAHLEQQVNRFLEYNNVPWCGPALENLPDCLLAVELIRPGAGKHLQDYLAAKMLTRQRSEGYFIAGPNDNWRYYEWIGSDRGESIFGTATTLRLLMQLQKKNVDTFAGEQMLPVGDPWSKNSAPKISQTPTPDHPQN